MKKKKKVNKPQFFKHNKNFIEYYYYYDFVARAMPCATLSRVIDHVTHIVIVI